MNKNSRDDRKLTRVMFIMPVGSAIGFAVAYWLDEGLGNRYAIQTFAASALLSSVTAVFMGLRIWRRGSPSRSDRALRRDGEGAMANHVRHSVLRRAPDFSDFVDLSDKFVDRKGVKR